MARMVIVGRTPCKIAPRILNTSPSSHTIRNARERPSAEERRKFSMICGEKTTTQHAIEMEPKMPLRASISIEEPREGDIMICVIPQ